MKNQAHFFEIIAQEAIMGIMAFDSDSEQCLYINRLARESLEIPMSEPDHEIPVKLCDLFPEEARGGIARPFSREFLRHEGMSQDVLMRRKNGLALIANVGIKHVTLDDGAKAILVMFQDITVQKKLQREVQLKQEEIHKAFTELLEQNRQLKELDLAKDKFVALTTHELRTPLSAIVATAEVVNMDLCESPEQKTEFIKTIYEQSLHLMELVNDILDFAKIRAGKMDFYVEPIVLGPVLEKLVSSFSHMADQGNVRLSIRLPEQPVTVFADSLRIREVINNVVNNAIKYNREGGSVTVTLSPSHDGKARVTVTDTGPGIPADKIVHVFNEFETVGNVSKHHKGTGLGMPISKHLVQAMGGDLTLESVEGQGTSFFIDVPTEKILDEGMYRSRPDAWADLAA